MIFVYFSYPDTIQTGIGAYDELSKQNEKLLHAKCQLDEIDNDLKNADHKLDGMESLWNRFLNLFVPDSNTMHIKPIEPKIVNNKTYLLNDYPITTPVTQQAYIHKQDCDLDNLIEMTIAMKNIASEMGQSIDDSNKLIKQICDSTSRSTIKAKTMIQKEKILMK